MDVQVVVFVRLVCDLQLFHVLEDDAEMVRLQRTLLTHVVDSRRNVMLDPCQQVCEGESWIGVELAIEEFYH